MRTKVLIAVLLMLQAGLAQAMLNPTALGLNQVAGAWLTLASVMVGVLLNRLDALRW